MDQTQGAGLEVAHAKSQGLPGAVPLSWVNVPVVELVKVQVDR